MQILDFYDRVELGLGILYIFIVCNLLMLLFYYERNDRKPFVVVGNDC